MTVKTTEPQTIHLTISLSEANLILESLGQLPFARVHEVISKIHQQASEQIQRSLSPDHVD